MEVPLILQAISADILGRILAETAILRTLQFQHYLII